MKTNSFIDLFFLLFGFSYSPRLFRACHFAPHTTSREVGTKKNIVKLDYINIYVIDGKFMFFAAVCWLGIKYKDGT